MMKTWKASVGAVGLALVLAACGGNEATDVAAPSPVKVTVESPDVAVEVAPELDVEPEPEVADDAIVVDAKAGDLIRVPIAQGLLQTTDPLAWNFMRESTGVVQDADTSNPPSGDVITLESDDADTFYMVFEVIEAGTGTITMSYTNPDVGEVTNISIIVNAS